MTQLLQSGVARVLGGLLSPVRIVPPTVATYQVKGNELVPVPSELRPKPDETVISQ